MDVVVQVFKIQMPTAHASLTFSGKVRAYTKVQLNKPPSSLRIAAVRKSPDKPNRITETKLERLLMISIGLRPSLSLMRPKGNEERN